MKNIESATTPPVPSFSPFVIVEVFAITCLEVPEKVPEAHDSHHEQVYLSREAKPISRHVCVRV